jgi:hypothetical protein
MSEPNQLDQTSKNNKPLKKSRKKRVLIAFFAILVIAVGIFVYEVNNLTGTAKGVITHSSEKITSNSFDFTPVEVSGSLISFSYPKFMSVYTAAQKQNYPILASYEYSYYDIKTWVLAVTIIKLVSGSLSADSTYYADQLNPSVYSQTTDTVNGKSYTVMTDQDDIGFNKVAFSLNDGMSAEIGLIGEDNLGTTNLQKTFNMVLASFSWN